MFQTILLIFKITYIYNTHIYMNIYIHIYIFNYVYLCFILNVLVIFYYSIIIYLSSIKADNHLKLSVMF